MIGVACAALAVFWHLVMSIIQGTNLRGMLLKQKVTAQEKYYL